MCFTTQVVSVLFLAWPQKTALVSANLIKAAVFHESRAKCQLRCSDAQGCSWRDLLQSFIKYVWGKAFAFQFGVHVQVPLLLHWANLQVAWVWGMEKIALSMDDARKSLRRDLGLESLWIFFKRVWQAEVSPLGFQGLREDHIYQKHHRTGLVIVSYIQSFLLIKFGFESMLALQIWLVVLVVLPGPPVVKNKEKMQRLWRSAIMTQINSLCMLNIKTFKTAFFSHRLKNSQNGNSLSKYSALKYFKEPVGNEHFPSLYWWPLQCLKEMMVLRGSVRHLWGAVDWNARL